ncbi:hypothetical protein [Chachezhania sediminis]|uniref:hypothetical protein n=1 Tax=Chachezhania sediminis TaxID=2599291 RepID=UPI00131C8D16|nr:hypothetical protein [Chachezhania sediminis]
MTTYMSREVQDGLDAARREALAKSSRLRVGMGDKTFPVLKMWQDGFSVDAEKVPSLRGLVDLYDGARHLRRALIVASEEEAGMIRYDYKLSTEAADSAPLDFYRDPGAPVALLPE